MPEACDGLADRRFSIEVATRGDVTDIRAIELAGAAMFTFDDLPQSVRYRSTDLHLIREAIQDARIWKARYGETKTVGFVYADIVDDNVHIVELDVLPDFMRRGIGSALVKHVCHWADQKGSGVVTLITFRHVPWNAPFYESLGFKTIPEAELGPQISGLMQEEFELGLNMQDRICMKFGQCQQKAMP